MLTLTFLLKGALLGFSIAAPVGPVGILCIRRTMNSGRTSGIATGMGSSCIHTLYGAIGAFGLTALSDFLTQAQFWLKLFGGSFLIYLGINIFLSNIKTPSSNFLEKPNLIKHFVSTLFLSMTNPMTLISFIAIYTSLEITHEPGNYALPLIFVLGVFIGSISWWLTLSHLISTFRARIDAQILKWINRISGLIIVSFGSFSLYTGLWQRFFGI